MEKDMEAEPCKCGNKAEPLHTCPFRKEMYDDTETLCNCCADCLRDCVADI